MNTFPTGGFAPDFAVDWHSYDAAIWKNLSQKLTPIADPDVVPLEQLVGMEQQKTRIITNTKAFVAGQGGHHALLWGARGCGKSSLIRALLPVFANQGLRMIQLNVESLYVLEALVDHLREQPWHFVLLCDDFSFSGTETGLAGLKVLLEGSLQPVPANVLLYASSNRRHLLPETMHDQADVVGEEGELHFADSVEAELSLADRFGLWLSFYNGSKDDYLAIVERMLTSQGSRLTTDWREQAMRFARQRGVFSGRTAKHFVDGITQQQSR